MPKPPSLALRLAQSLASESRDAVRDMASRKEILALWRDLRPENRKWLVKKARRILARLQTLGPT